MKRLVITLLSIGLALPIWAQQQLPNQAPRNKTNENQNLRQKEVETPGNNGETAGQEMKEAGNSTKKATKKTYHKTKKGVKKGANEGAEKTGEAAGAVENKTEQK